MSIDPILKSVFKLRKVEKNKNSHKCIVHKYRRFRADSKTYRTDVYFCEDCGHRVSLERMFGVSTRCYKCNMTFIFKFVNGLPLKPECDNCIGKDKPTLNLIPENGNPLAFLEMGEKSESDKVNSRDELVNLTLKELGLD